MGRRTGGGRRSGRQKSWQKSWQESWQKSWQKSSYSSSGHDCLQVARLGGGLWLRESDEPGVALNPSVPTFAALLRQIKADGLDDLCG